MEIILKENWEHARYCEYEMILFTSLYGAIVAGALIFMSRIDFDERINLSLAFFLSFFLLIFSILGFMVAISQTLGHKNHILNVLMILDYWNMTGFFKDPKKPFHLKRSYRYFYEITIAFFVALSIFYVSEILNPIEEPNKLFILIPILIGVFIFVCCFIEKVLYRCYWEEHILKRNLLIEALRKSTGGQYYCPNWDELFENEDPIFWNKVDPNNLRSKNQSLWRCKRCFWISRNKWYIVIIIALHVIFVAFKMLYR